MSNASVDKTVGSLPNEERGGGEETGGGSKGSPDMTQLTTNTSSTLEAETLSLDQDTEIVMKAFEKAQMEKLAKLTSFEESLKALVIQPGDVDFLVRHFDVTKGLAERVLRMAGGDVKAAVTRMTH